MIFCAAALKKRTRTLRLGTGVLSVLHNPLWTADRVVQLDHLSRGRFMFGVGPGRATSPTPTWSASNPPSSVAVLKEGMDAIMHLLRSEEPLTVSTDWFTLQNAKCQLPLYSDDLDIAVAAIQSPSGPRLAGKHGLGLLSIGATMQIGADVLGLHYDVWNELAVENGFSADRDKWRLVGVFHIAETKEQAFRDVEYGIEHWFDYLQHTAAAPQFLPQGDTLQERIAWVNETGIGAIGTTEDCIRQVENLSRVRAASAPTCAWTTTLPTPRPRRAATSWWRGGHAPLPEQHVQPAAGCGGPGASGPREAERRAGGRADRMDREARRSSTTARH